MKKAVVMVLTLILCLDDRNGMAFNGRRQSMDSVVRARMLTKIGQCKLWMDHYSAKQFTSHSGQVLVDDDFMSAMSAEDACFMEVQDPKACLRRCRRLIIYRWNRVYPADLSASFENCLDRMKLIGKEDFVGSSHEKITEEIYEIL